MSRLVAHLAVLVSLAAAGPALAAPSGPAAPALAAYMAATRIPCYSHAGEGTCSIASRADRTTLFHGGPGASTDEAVAFVSYQYDITGNGLDQMAIVLRRDGKAWRVVGRADATVGSAPRKVRFLPGAITYVGSFVGPDDPRSDPRGKATFRIDVGERAVTFVGKSGGGARPPRH